MRWLIPGMLVVAACTGDQQLVVRNEDPTATITSHEDGDVVLEGRTVTLVGRVSDADDPREDLIAGFEVNGEDACDKAAPGDGGSVTCEVLLETGEAAIALVVVDPNDATGEERITLTVQPTDAPVVTLSAPDESALFWSDRPVRVAGTAIDTEDDEASLQLTITSDVDETEVEAAPTSDGSFDAEISLSPGRHTLTVRATDSDDKVGQAVARIDVLPPNETPSCEAVVASAATESGLDATLAFTVSDAEQDADALTVVFSSDLDGELATRAPEPDGTATLITDALSDGRHVITALFTDNAGDTCTATMDQAVGQPPGLTVDRPADGETVTEGEEAVFEVTVSDPDDPETDLIVRIESDLDGELITLSPDSTGSGGFRTDALSRGRHTLTTRVTDPFGLYREERRALIVNGRPSAPVVSLDPDPARTGDALSVSIDTPSVDPEGASITYTYAWTRNGSSSTASTSDTLPSSATTKGDTWAVSVTPSDGSATGPAGTASLAINNTAPTTGTPTLSPTSPKTADAITCTPVGAADADGDSITHTYAWTVDGTSSSVTAAELPASEHGRGDAITCTVRPSDGTDTGTAQTSAALTTGNTAPSITGVSVSPSAPTADGTLTCTYSGYADADGDTDASTYAWEVDGKTVGTSATLSGAFSKADTVTCTVTPSDGTDTGTARSASVTIVNKAPSITSVAISPSTATTADALTCTYTGYSDIDGDADNSTIAWTIGGSTVGTSATLPAGTADKGDTVTCTVTPSDGSASGTPVTATRTLVNAVPTVSAVAISPSSPKVGDTLSCGWTFSDADGDSDASTVTWTRGGTTLGTGTTLSSGFARGDAITCTVTPSDGTATGTAVASSPVTIQNTAPSISSVSVSPSSPTADDTLTCSYSGYSDADGDTDRSTYAWTVDGTAAGTGRTLTGGFAKGDTITCTVTPSDGTDTGTPVSSAVTAMNKAPSITSVTISPSGATTEDALTCAYSGYTDVDGDADKSTYAWTVGGSTVGTAATLPAGTADKGDTVTCTVTPSDGTATGTPVSGTITLDNAVPEVSGVTISPSSPTVEDDLSCTYTFTDADGDSDASTIAWTRGGTSLGSGPSLTSGYAKGETITCTVTPDDGTDTGTTASASVTIGNAAPEPPTVTFSPTEWIVGQTTATELSCVATGASDPDGDALTTTYAWFVNSSSVTTAASKASDLAPSQFSAEDEVECEVTVSDGSLTATAFATIDIFEQPDWGAIQFPCSVSETAGTTFSVFGRVYMDGVTNGSGEGPGITAEAGIGPDGSDPTKSLSGWTFVAGSYNTDLGNDDEYAATLTAPSTAGSYDIAWRFSADGGLSWIYVDQHSSCGSGLAGFSDGYSPANSTPLTVRAP